LRDSQHAIVPSRVHRPHSVPRICGCFVTLSETTSWPRLLFWQRCHEGQPPMPIGLGVTFWVAKHCRGALQRRSSRLLFVLSWPKLLSTEEPTFDRADPLPTMHTSDKPDYDRDW